MKVIFKITGIVLCCLLNVSAYSSDKKVWMDKFSEEPQNISSTGSNTYIVLEPGYQLVLEGKEDNEIVSLTITVLDETKKIGNIETRIVEERESKNGQLIEVSRNYFAVSKKTNNVYYFGEDVDIYSAGKIVSHDGAWVDGKDGAKYGLMIPGKIVLGLRYYQEIAPNVAMDRAEVVSVTETIKTPAGTFKNCLKTQEGTALNPQEKGYKFYAPKIGLVKDGNLKLVKYGYIKKTSNQ